MMKMRHLLLVMGLLGGGCWAAAASPRTLLILPFDAGDGVEKERALAAALPELLADAFSAFPDRVAVLDRGLTTEAAHEISLSLERHTDDRRSAGWAGAEYILKGSVFESKGRRHIEAGLYDAATTQLSRSFAVEGAPALTLTERLAGDVARALAGNDNSREEIALALPTDSDPETSQHRIDGLGEYHLGRYPAACAAFMKALRRQPNDPTSRFWLAKSLEGAGLTEQARVAYEEFQSRFPNHRRGTEAAKALQRLSIGTSP